MEEKNTKMKSSTLFKVLVIVFLLDRVLAIKKQRMMERLNYIEDRLNVESKFRREDFAVVFKKLEGIDTILQQLLETKSDQNKLITSEGINARIPDQTNDIEKQLRKELALFLKAFKEEKMENIRFRRQIPVIENDVKDLKIQTELVRQINETLSNSLREIAKDIKTGKETIEKFEKNVEANHEIYMKEMETNSKITRDLREEMDNIGDSQDRFMQEMVKEIKLTEDIAERIINIEDKHEMCMETVGNISHQVDVLGGNITSVIPKTELPKYYSCLEVYQDEKQENGIYQIYQQSAGTKFPVYCDMTTDGGGWTVFQRRKDGSVDFYRDWNDYKFGFGKLNGEFWLGNEYLHILTSTGLQELRIDLEDFDGNHAYAKYSNFNIGPESINYRLEVSGYTGDAGDSLGRHNRCYFSTKDRDNESSGENCAQKYPGAWWFYGCHVSHLNGLYHHQSTCTSGVHKCIEWQQWEGHYFHSLKFTEMKLR